MTYKNQFYMYVYVTCVCVYSQIQLTFIYYYLHYLSIMISDISILPSQNYY